MLRVIRLIAETLDQRLAVNIEYAVVALFSPTVSDAKDLLLLDK